MTSTGSVIQLTIVNAKAKTIIGHKKLQFEKFNK